MLARHEHKRRVPTQNVDRSIMVCVHAMTAMPTGKRRLVLAALAGCFAYPVNPASVKQEFNGRICSMRKFERSRHHARLRGGSQQH